MKFVTDESVNQNKYANDGELVGKKVYHTAIKDGQNIGHKAGVIVKQYHYPDTYLNDFASRIDVQFKDGTVKTFQTILLDRPSGKLSLTLED